MKLGNPLETSKSLIVTLLAILLEISIIVKSSNNIKSINILLNPFNFTLNFRTENPEILLDNKKIKINHVNTNLSIKSILNDEFSIDNIKISLKTIKLKDLTLLARSFKNSAEFFLLDNQMYLFRRDLNFQKLNSKNLVTKHSQFLYLHSYTLLERKDQD